MKAEELVVLMSCPKMYELQRIVLEEGKQKSGVKRKLLAMLSKWFVQGEEWDAISKKIESYLQEHLKESWFDLHWQKRAMIRDDLFQIRRLYCWLVCNIKGTIQADMDLEMEFQEEYAGHSIRNLQIKADLLVEKTDGTIQGILLSPELPVHHHCHTKKAGNKACPTVEMLCLMGSMKRRYPGRPVEVIMAGLKPQGEEKGVPSIFGEEQNNHVIWFTGQEFADKKRKDMGEALKELLRKNRPMNCRNCAFEDICRYPVQDFTKIQEKSSVQNEKEQSVPQCIGSLPDYTDNQKAAIRHRKGPLRVCAGPGAGKTAVLTARIQELIREGQPPERILAVTFTKKAAKEILARIPSHTKPVVSTLHALAFQIVRQHEFIIGERKLVNRVDCMQMLLQVLNEAPVIHGAHYEKPGRKRGLLDSLFKDFAFINKHGLHRFEEIYPDKDIAGILQIKEMYEQKFVSSGYILFDDQIRLGVEILEGYSGIRKKVQESYDYIMVDEAQDLDEMQSQLIQLLVKATQNNIAIYGDADQSVYGFRGGSNQFMLDFPDLYPGTADIRLNDNFRSFTGILDAANMLIGHNLDRVPFEMRAHFQAEFRPVLIRKFRANRIGTFIHDLLDMGYRPEQIAVIARTNKELECMCDMLEKHNAEHPEAMELRFDRPKYYLWQDAVFQIILDLLTIYLGNYSDDKAWYRLLRISGISLYKKNQRKTLYEDYLAREEILSFDGEEKSMYLCAGEESSTVFQAFARIYRGCSFFSLPPRQAVSLAVEFFCGNEPHSREVAETLDEMMRARNIKTAEEVWRYLSAVKRFRDETRLYDSDSNDGRIRLLTAHDSKGKEFEAVLVYGIDEFERGDPQEDRRLLYVALTRAKEKLYVTEICNGKSMFLQEFSEKLDEMEGIRYA